MALLTGSLFSIIATAVVSSAAGISATWLLGELNEYLKDVVTDAERRKIIEDAGLKVEDIENATTTPAEKTENTENTQNITGGNVQAFPEKWLTQTAPPTTNTGGIQIQRPGETIPDNSTADGATDLPNVGEIVTPTDKENSMVESTTPETKPSTNVPTTGGSDGGVIKDQTGENEEIKINNAMSVEEWLKLIEKNQKEQWAREDAIRKETQAREDSAYQRSVADMLKAGINPNLMNVQPAASGGGITQATGKDFSGLLKQIEIEANALQKELDRAFQKDENAKDRALGITGDLVQSLITMVLLGGAVGKGG